MSKFLLTNLLILIPTPYKSLSFIGTLGVRKNSFFLVRGCELLEVLSFGYSPPSSTKVVRVRNSIFSKVSNFLITYLIIYFF